MESEKEQYGWLEHLFHLDLCELSSNKMRGENCIVDLLSFICK